MTVKQKDLFRGVREAKPEDCEILFSQLREKNIFFLSCSVLAASSTTREYQKPYKDIACEGQLSKIR